MFLFIPELFRLVSHSLLLFLMMIIVINPWSPVRWMFKMILFKWLFFICHWPFMLLHPSFFFFSSYSCSVILAELYYTCMVFMLVSSCPLLFFKVETELFSSDSEQLFKNMMLKERGNKLENATISTRKSVSHHIIPASLKSPHFIWGPHFTCHNLIDCLII